MAERIFNQIFERYWIESDKIGLPCKSGVYCVYECTYNPAKNNVSIQKLIYIGESENANSRIVNHEKRKEWEKHVKEGNQLCYSFTVVEQYYRVIVAAAFIYRHKPPVNTEFKDHFPFDKTTVKSKGEIALLDEYFVINTNKKLPIYVSK